MSCIFCNTKVASGGDRHKGAGTPTAACPVQGKRGEHYEAKQRAKRRAAGDLNISRGAAVAGTGKPSASSDKSKKKKAEI